MAFLNLGEGSFYLFFSLTEFAEFTELKYFSFPAKPE